MNGQRIVQLVGAYPRKDIDRAFKGVVLTALRDEIRSWRVDGGMFTTSQCAERLDITFKEVKNIFAENALASFSLKELNELALKAGLRVTFTIDKPKE